MTRNLASDSRRWPTFEEICALGTFDAALDQTAALRGDTRLEFGTGEVLNYRGLSKLSSACAAALKARGLEQNDVLAIALPVGPELLAVLFGALRAGVIPTLVPSVGVVSRAQFAERLQQVCRLESVRAIVSQSAWRGRLCGALAGLTAPPPVLNASELLACNESYSASLHASDLAVFQYSSGSTHDPKGIALTHRNVMTAIGAIIDGGEIGADDVVFQWMPLHHDMGLFSLLAAVTAGAAQYLTDPWTPFRDPAGWLRALSQKRGTYFGSTSTALGFLCESVDDATLAELDLSATRFICVGAEPLEASTLARFLERFSVTGIDPDLICPAYGMAEASLGITSRRRDQPLRIDCVNRNALGARGEVERVASDDPRCRRIFALGTPLKGIALRVVNERGESLADAIEGEIEIAGDAVISQYYGKSRADSHRGDWFRTGDLGYLRDGELYLTGRIKQLLIVNGVKYHAEDCEHCLIGVAAIFRGRCVAIDLTEGKYMTLVVETQEHDAALRRALSDEVCARIRHHLGLHRAQVALAKPRTIPYTTSGKPKRLVLRQSILGGALPAGALEYFDSPGAH